MNAGPWLKKPWGDEADFAIHLRTLERLIRQSQWQSASVELKGTERDYRKVTIRIQFSVERDELNRIADLLARIKGAIAIKDQKAALVELFEAKQHWKQLGK
jgi:ribulose 1,5-bisphosphate carboxylase large subunit-like protein